MNTQTKVSVIIPVYNEADRIIDCLRAIMRQTVRPFEVIVIDNNSTDHTVALAKLFPFARIIREHKQGVVHARNRGFNAARGDIIARIDADTIIADDWIATVIDLFADGRLDAVSGAVTYRDIVAPKLVGRIDLFWRRRMARLLGREVALQGANMALRGDAWQAIKTNTCTDKGLHEDFDLAIHLCISDKTVRFDERLIASICYRQADYDFKSFAHYALISPQTYLRHNRLSGRYMYEVVIFVIALYPIISMLSRAYDEALGRFSLRRLFGAATTPRVNPAMFVD